MNPPGGPCTLQQDPCTLQQDPCTLQQDPAFLQQDKTTIHSNSISTPSSRTPAPFSKTPVPSAQQDNEEVFQKANKAWRKDRILKKGQPGHTDPPSCLAAISSSGLTFKIEAICSQVARTLWLSQDSALVPSTSMQSVDTLLLRRETQPLV